jgi:O-antigen/teichoic acid export membrane protein
VNEPLAYRVVRGGLFVAAGSYFNILFGFLTKLLLTQLLGLERFGVVALVLFYTGLVAQLVSWGSISGWSSG